MVPVPPAQASLLQVTAGLPDINLEPEDFDSAIFEIDRLRRMTVSAFEDMERERIRHAQRSASYEAEIALLRQRLREARQR